MPRPVCGTCQLEMDLTRHVTVQFDAQSVGGPYQQWQADEARCPGCGAVVAFRYASQPCWQHFEKDKTPDVPNYIVVEHAVRKMPPLRIILPGGNAMSFSPLDWQVDIEHKFERWDRTPLGRTRDTVTEVRLTFTVGEYELTGMGDIIRKAREHESSAPPRLAPPPKQLGSGE
jgi:hypothetical protein